MFTGNSSLHSLLSLPTGVGKATGEQKAHPGEQHHGEIEILQFSPEDTFGVELWAFEDESQPCVFLLRR